MAARRLGLFNRKVPLVQEVPAHYIQVTSRVSYRNAVDFNVIFDFKQQDNLGSNQKILA